MAAMIRSNGSKSDGFIGGLSYVGPSEDASRCRLRRMSQVLRADIGPDTLLPGATEDRKALPSVGSHKSVDAAQEWAARALNRASARGSVVVLLVACLACSSQPPSTSTPVGPSGPPSAPVRVLMLTATAGFRHDSIVTARQVLTGLGAASGEFAITATEDVAAITATDPGDLRRAVLRDDQRRARVHSRPESRDPGVCLGWQGLSRRTQRDRHAVSVARYGALIGAYFKEHPWTQTASVIVEDRAHPATTGLGDRFSLEEEFYTFRENPRNRVQVLLRLDAGSVGSSGDYPLAWVQSYGNGRVVYNALGHFPSTWTDSRFQGQIAAAIRWAAGR